MELSNSNTQLGVSIVLFHSDDFHSWEKPIATPSIIFTVGQLFVVPLPSLPEICAFNFSHLDC
jgi:hypothetical protein